MSFMAAARNARRGCWSRWNFSLKSGDGSDRGRVGGRDRGGPDADGTVVPAQAAFTKAVPDHLPRERIVIAAPESCPCCGSAKLSKLGEDITETLEVVRAVEGNSDGAGKVLVPDMREDHAAGAVPCHSARLRRGQTCWP